MEFEDCWRRRVIIEDDDLRIPTISLEDLKRNKRVWSKKEGSVGLGRIALRANIVYGATRPKMALFRCVRDLAISPAILPGPVFEAHGRFGIQVPVPPGRKPGNGW